MTDQIETRESLIQRAGNPDDENAWDEFVSYYEEFIYSVVRQMGIAERDQSDLVQTVLEKLWKSLAGFELDSERARFRTWLSTVIRNTVIDFIEKEQRFSRKHREFGDERVYASRFLTETSKPEMYAVIEREWQMHVTNLAMDAIRPLFSDSAITVFSMSLDGKSIEDISGELGIKPNSVYKVKNRVKSRLVKEVKRIREELEWV
jgi:RNA polymerase sigma factor (sigma-70 family)